MDKMALFYTLTSFFWEAWLARWWMRWYPVGRWSRVEHQWKASHKATWCLGVNAANAWTGELGHNIYDTWLKKDCFFDIWKKIVLWCYDACLFCIVLEIFALGHEALASWCGLAAEEIEREMRKCHAPDGEESVSSMRWRVQRSRQPMDLDLTPTLLHSDGTEHIVATCPGWSSLVQGAKVNVSEGSKIVVWIELSNIEKNLPSIFNSLIINGLV